jgi:hypothetical protein
LRDETARKVVTDASILERVRVSWGENDQQKKTVATDIIKIALI